MIGLERTRPGRGRGRNAAGNRASDRHHEVGGERQEDERDGRGAQANQRDDAGIQGQLEATVASDEQSALPENAARGEPMLRQGQRVPLAPLDDDDDATRNGSFAQSAHGVPPVGHSTAYGAQPHAVANDALLRLISGLLSQQQMPVQQPTPTYHVIPDLSRNIEDFTGDGDSVRASEWIENLESMRETHEWTERYLFEAARLHLKGGARDWMRTRIRELHTWEEFRRAFRETFVVRDDTSTRWARMKARSQGRNESITQYYFAKYKMCRALNLTFRETKAEILIGLWSHDLSNAVMPTMQSTSDELLHDLNYYDKLLGQRSERVRASRNAPSSKAPAQTAKASSHESERAEAGAVRSESKSNESKSGARPRKCFNCDKPGHLSRDCPEPKKEMKCYTCNETGHISRNCPKAAKETKPTVQTIGEPSENAAAKYLKNAMIDDRECVAFIDTGSSECTIRATKVLTEQFKMKPQPMTLKGFGPAEYVVTSPGIVCANITIDGVEVPKVPIRVVPDDVQPVDVIIGRSYTEQPYVEYRKVRETLTFYENNELPSGPIAASTSHTNTSAVTLPPSTVSFVDVIDKRNAFSLPVANTSDQTQILKEGRATLRGDISRMLLIEKPTEAREPIPIEDLNVGKGQPNDVINELHTIINEYRDCISTSLSDLGCAKNVEMEIKVKENSTPVCCKPYRATERERTEIKEILSDWRQAGIITDTQSAYASPVLLVKKKTGESRLCVDFRKLNQITERVHFPLPNIDDHLAQVRDSSLFIVLDLAHGYLQIPLSKEARAKTAIITSEETAEFTRMVFGLMNGPAYFSKAMHRALGPLRDKVVLYYLDDILIPGKSWDDLRPKLRLVFDALREAGFTIKLSKCQFLYDRIAYLGHEISAKGIEPGSSKVAAIRDFPTPRNVHELRRFLGLVSCFRKFVPWFANIARPLTNLLKSNVAYEWETPQREAFTELKKKLTEHPTLQTFNPRAETELHTDASAMGLAAMLLQKDAAGTLKLVYAISRRTSETESRYHSSKLELLAIIWAVTRLRPLIANVPFTVVTDCQALCHLSTQRTMNPQMIRWNDLLSDYDYRIIHRAGVKLAHVDAMSRAPVESHDSRVSETMLTIQTDDDLVRIYQYVDRDLQERKNILSKPTSERTSEEKNHVNDYECQNGILYKRVNGRSLYVVPKPMRKSLVVRFHDLKSHQGIERTFRRLSEHYYFPRMKAYVRRHISACLQCLESKSKPGKQGGELHPIPPGHRPFATVHMDHLGPFVSSARGNKFVLALVDNLTKFSIIRAVKNTKTNNVIRVLDEFVQTYGAPVRFISDRGTCFTSRAFEEFCAKHGIRHTINSPRHPQANGQVERLNAVLVPAIRSNLADEHGRDWDKNIRKMQTDLNEMINASTGKSPFELVYGYVPRRDEGAARILTRDDETTYNEPRELRTIARERIISAQQKAKTYYDKNRARNTDYDVGDIVYVRVSPTATGESTKLQAKYRGPLVIVAKLPSDTYRIASLNDDADGRRYASTAHASQIKIWKPEVGEPGEESDSTDEYDLDTAAGSLSCKKNVKTIVCDASSNETRDASDKSANLVRENAIGNESARSASDTTVAEPSDESSENDTLEFEGSQSTPHIDHENEPISERDETEENEKTAIVVSDNLCTEKNKEITEKSGKRTSKRMRRAPRKLDDYVK